MIHTGRHNISFGFLPVFLAFLLLFSPSCKKKILPGTDILPDGAGIRTLSTDTLSLVCYTVREDSLRTDHLGRYLLGRYTDPLFGLSVAGIFTGAALPTNNVSLGDTPVPDSVVLTLAYAGAYGDTTQPLSAEVYEISQAMDPAASYYSNTVFTYYPGMLGRKTFYPRPGDSILIDGVNRAPHLRIRLSDLFAQKLAAQSGGANFADNTAFQDFMRGLYIASQSGPEPGYKTGSNGNAILYVDPGSPVSGLTLYYHNSSGDSLYITFPFNDSCATSNYYQHVYAGRAAEAALNNPDTLSGDSLLFIQSMAGIKTHLKIPYLANLGKVVINRAELVLTVADNNILFPPPASMLCIRADSTGANAFITDQFESASYYGGTKTFETDSDLGAVTRYRFNLARHFQQVVNGELKDYGLYLLTYPSSEIADRVVIGGSRHLSLKPKLNLVYTLME